MNPVFLLSHLVYSDTYSDENASGKIINECIIFVENATVVGQCGFLHLQTPLFHSLINVRGKIVTESHDLLTIIEMKVPLHNILICNFHGKHDQS